MEVATQTGLNALVHLQRLPSPGALGAGVGGAVVLGMSAGCSCFT